MKTKFKSATPQLVMYVCLCVGVSDRQIRKVIAEGASSVEEVMRCTRAGLCCGSCKPAIAAMLEQPREEQAPGPARRALPRASSRPAA